MRGHPRIRKTAKWCGLAVSVALAVVWISSAWWWASWQRAAPATVRSFQVGQGQIDLFLTTNARHWSFTPEVRLGRNHPPHLFFGFEWINLSGPGALSDGMLTVPIWALVLSAAMLTTIISWLDRRAGRRGRDGTCPACGYDLAGLPPASPCPECGSAA